MKIMLMADIHGNVEKFSKAMDFFYNEKIDQLIILGDISGYSQINNRQIANMLFGVDNLILIEGNNDYDDDQYPVRLLRSHTIDFNKYKLHLCHGHYHPYFDLGEYNIFAQGHTHRASIYKEKNNIFINPGSIGRPRDKSKGSFIILSDKAITLFDLDCNILDEMFL